MVENEELRTEDGGKRTDNGGFENRELKKVG